MVISADLVRNIVGIVGNATALFLFFSPVPTFVQIWRKGSVEQYSPAPYLATLANCIVWMLYGLPVVHPNSTLIVTMNGTGTTIELVYIILFLIYSNKNKKLKVMALMFLQLVFFMLLSILVFTLAHGTKRRSMIVGIICIGFNVMMYVSPLSIMKMVITTKSVEYMPFWLSFAAFINCLIWSCYALLRFDPFILIPNGVGALLSILQLIIYAIYCKSIKRQQVVRERSKDDNIDSTTVVVMVNANGDTDNNSDKQNYARQNGHV